MGIVFNFFGDAVGDCHVAAQHDKFLGACWAKDDRVVGAMLVGSPGPTPDDAKRLHEVAWMRPAFTPLWDGEEEEVTDDEPPSKRAKQGTPFERIGIFVAKL